MRILLSLLVVLLALIGFLIYQIFSRENLPPELHITTTYQAEMKNCGFKVLVENNGQETAEAVKIKLSLYQNGKLWKMVP